MRRERLYSGRVAPSIIVDGKLRRNYRKEIQQQWAAEPAAGIKQADANWLKLADKE